MNIFQKMLDIILKKAKVNQDEVITELIKEVSLDEIDKTFKTIRGKKIEYLDFKKVSVQETKNADGSLRLVAIASTDSVDRGMDIVIPTGIKTTNIKNGIIPMLLQHDHDKIIGGWDKWYIKDNQFIVEGTFLAPQNEEQKNAYEKIKSKVLNGISIGFIIDKVSFDKDIRILDEIELIEVSVVTIPMNQDAYIISVEELKNVNKESISSKSATAVEVQPTTEPVISPESNDTQIPAPSEEQPVASEKDEEIAKLKEENDKLKAKVSELETEITDYETVIEETSVEMEELLKAKRSLYEK